MKNIKVFIAIILITILGFAVYGNSLKNEFIWDDEYLIKENVYIKNWSFLPEIFTKNIGAGSGKKDNYYRPLQIFTYLIDHSLWKLNVTGYHLTNILLHIFVAIAIFLLVNILYDDWLLSLFTSVLYVIHPIHTEAVTYISGRTDLLSALFLLLCLIFYIKSTYFNSNGISLFILTILSYILALLSRESSLILPVLLLLFHFSFKTKVKPAPSLSLLTITFVYILLRVTVLKFVSVDTLFPVTTFVQRVPGFFVAIASYIKLLFLPFHLHMEYGNKLFNFKDPRAILGAIILFSLLIYAFRKRRQDKLVFFSISWFFLTLLPVSGLYPINAYMAEHWLYLPSIGFFLIMAKILKSLLYKNKIFMTIFLIGLIIFYSYLTIRQNNYWKNTIVFCEHTLKYVPDSERAYSALGVAYSEKGNQKKALTLYKKAIEVNPNYVPAYNNLANIYNETGNYQEAIRLYKKAAQLDSDDAEVFTNLTVAYYNAGKVQEAITACKKAIEINPNFAIAYNNLGKIYYDIGRKEEAIALFKKALEISPGLAVAQKNLDMVTE